MGTILIIVCIVICFFVVKCMHRLEELIDLAKGLEELIDLVRGVDGRIHAINGWVASYLLREELEKTEKKEVDSCDE